jgi:hypothetical protein
MNQDPLNHGEIRVLKAPAAFGFVVPNGLFLYHAATNFGAVRAALTNPISAVFLAEAMFLMLLFAWLLERLGVRRPDGVAFVAWSLLGSLAFSVPAALVSICSRGATGPSEQR